mgnify:CR=1 FL=1
MSKKLEIINQVCDKIDDIYYHYASAFGVTDTELCVLYSLLEHDGKYLQIDICRDWHCSLQTVHTSIKNMEKKGLVKLTCQTGNKKNKYIHLSETGKELIDRIMVPLVKAEEEAFGMLSEEEQDVMLPLLQKYANALDTTIGRITRQAEEHSL